MYAMVFKNYAGHLQFFSLLAPRILCGLSKTASI